MATTAERIRDFIELTRDLKAEEQFCAKFPFPFLVHEKTRAADDDGDAPKGRAGSERSTMRVKSVAVPVGDGFGGEGDVWIYRVCPRDMERNEGSVTLGRAEDCDIVIDNDTISAQHAAFTMDVDDDGERTFFVTDMDSVNGTFVDGKQAPAATPVVLEDMTSVRIGLAVKLQFFTAPAFFQFLDYYRRIKR